MSIPRYSSTISDTGATIYSALSAIIISPPPKSCRLCPFPSFFRLVRSFSHSLSPFPFFLFLRSALILALHGKKSVASCSRLRGSGRNYTEARTATDQHDRRPNYYYGKNRAGSCVLIFCKNLGAKRETRNCANKCRIPRWSLVSATMARTCKVIEHEDRPTEVPPDPRKKTVTFDIRTVVPLFSVQRSFFFLRRETSPVQ